jgi:sulfoxide reductase heme-binding subunit YedZ
MNVPWRDRRGRFLPFKAAVFASLFLPLFLYPYWFWADELTGRAVMECVHGSGLWAIRLLTISLAITPFSRALEWPGLLLVRRNVGVAAACYGVLHLCLYVVDQNFKLLTVVAEIALRFYLTIGFVALLAMMALAWTSTDAWVKSLGRNWKRLHKLAYPIGILTLLHFYIQSKLKISEPAFVSGLFFWLMLWRLTPETWRRKQGSLFAVKFYGALAVAAGLATALLETGWYAVATNVNAWRVLYANESIDRGLRPAHWVFVVTAGLAIMFVIRRWNRSRQQTVRVGQGNRVNEE